MSLYSSGVQLLSRPPRSALSIGPENTRATLPDFTSVSELAVFVDRLNNWHLHVPHLRAQAITGSTLIFFFIIVVGLTMARRVYEGKFWVLRVIRKSTGVILVPNPILAFLIMSGFYGIVFTPLFLVAALHYADHSGPPANILLWFSLPFMPLAFGLAWAILGTLFATPEALPSTSDNSRLAPLRRFFRRPSVANSLGILFPLIMAIAVAIPAIIADVQTTEAFAMEDQWTAKYASMSTFTQEMVQDAQQSWFMGIKAAKTASVVFIMWTIFAFAMGITYLYVSFTLIMTVRRDLARAKRLERQSHLAVVVEKPKPVMTSSVPQVVADALQANKLPARNNGLNNHALPTPAPAAATHRSDSTEESTDTAGVQQRKNLEQALFHIYVQLVVIGPGAFFLGTISLIFAIALYSKLEQPSNDGGNQLEPWIGGLLTTLMYVICLIGGLNILTVGYKTYENAGLFHRQAAGTTQIEYKDVVRGPAHLRSTFFEPPSQHRYNPAATVPILEEETELPSVTSPGKAPPSWDVEAEPSYHSVDSSASANDRF